MKMKNKWLSVILLVGIVLLVNLLSRDFFFRIDATEEGIYTLSKATKDILNELEEPVTVSAYFTEDMPQQTSKALADFEDMLKEYATRSGGLVNYEFIDPNQDQELEQQAMQAGIRPVQLNVREKDEVVQKKVYMGAVISQGEQQDIIPLILPESPMEYNLTTAIKKVSVAAKPTIGMVQGHGEPDYNTIQQVYQSLGILYDIENVDLAESIPSRHRAILMLNPQDSLSPAHLQRLDDYLRDGGHLCLAFNAVEGNFQTAQGEERVTGLVDWLSTKGIQIGRSMILDASCSSVSVQQQQGFLRFNTQVEFPYLPRVINFIDHPITSGLEQVVFPFASPINYTGDSTIQFVPIVQSSDQSAIQNLPLYFDVQRRWTENDFPLGPQNIGVVLSGDFAGNGSIGKMVLFSDGDFPVSQGGGGDATADNFSLLVNAMDWLADDTGLIELRTKGVSSRPIEEMEEGKQTRLKWINFLLPIILVIAYGLFRQQRNKRIRQRRMTESYV